MSSGEGEPLLIDRISGFHHQPIRLQSDKLSSINAAQVRMVAIAVQPPSRAQVAVKLYPPVIARSRMRNTEGSLFAVAVLLDSQDEVLSETLGGTVLATICDLDNVGSSTRPCTAFVFADLIILSAGEYTIRVDIYSVDAAGGGAITLMEQIETNKVKVYNEHIAAGRPCKPNPEVPLVVFSLMLVPSFIGARLHVEDSREGLFPAL